MTPIALALQRVAKLEAELKEAKARVCQIERELNEACQDIARDIVSESRKRAKEYESQKRLD